MFRWACSSSHGTSGKRKDTPFLNPRLYNRFSNDRLNIRYLGLALLISIFLLWPDWAASQTPPLPIKSIEIRGNRRVEKNTIRFYIATRVGDRFSISKLRKDIKKIYDLGFFRNVKVDVNPFEGGLRVTFIVEEKPAVSQVRVAGNNKVDLEDILEKITVTSQSILSQGTVRESVGAIRSLYQEEGYYFARVESIVEEAGANQVNVEFQITEGEKVSIREIAFRGNLAFSDKAIRKTMQTEQKWLLSWFTDGDVYKEDQLQTDLIRIQVFYQNKGYIRVEVKEPMIYENRKENSLSLVIPIVEGKQYRVGKVQIEGDDVFTGDELRKHISFKKGDIYNRSRMNSDIVKITEAYAQKGHAFADIIPQTTINDDKRVADIKITPKKGRRAFIGRIFIKGNDFTRDKVIRREVMLLEGSLFDGNKLKRTRRRIRKLGYFEDVKIETKRGSKPDLLDVEIEVKEKPTGAISGGTGYSNNSGLLLFGEVRENNLFGRGQLLAFRLRRSDLDTTGSLNFMEPRVFDSNFALTSGIFLANDEFETYERDRSGGNLGFGRYLGESWMANLMYQFEENHIFNVKDTANSFVVKQKGVSSTSGVTGTLTRDTRDSRVKATDGGLTTVTNRVTGGIFGGDNKFFTFAASHKHYYPFFKRRVILMSHGRVTWAGGFGGKELPVFERAYLGGARSVRGFSFRGVGPRDSNKDPLGGEASLLFNLELQVPFVAGARAVVFFDAGQVYNKAGSFRSYDPFELRASVGTGLRILSPVGPLSLDWGFKLQKRTDEKLSEFHFGIGRAF